MRLGVQAAFDSLGPGEPGEAEAPAEQLELLADAGERRGAGRPAGSRNRSTKEWQRYLLERHGSPLEGAMALAARIRTPEEIQALAIELCCTMLEAAKIGLAAATAAAPYVHQRLPIAIEGDGVSPIPLFINLGGGDAAGEVGQMVLVRPTKKIEEYQYDIDADPIQSDEEQSDA